MSTRTQAAKKTVLDVGIDVSKKKLDICLLFSDKSDVLLKTTNSSAGVRKICSAFRKHSVSDSTPVIVESTGDCHLLLCLMLLENGYQVRLINPIITKKYQRSSIRGGKTDKIDAKRLTEIGIIEEEKSLPVFNETVESVSRKKLLSVLKKFEEAKQQLSATMNQWKETSAVLAPLGFPEIDFEKQEQAIKGIDQAITALEKRITETTVESIPKTKELAKIRGVSLEQASILMTGFEGKDFQTRDQLISFVGLDVRPRESGAWIGQRKLTKRGNAFLRKTLFQIGWSLMMNNKKYQEYYRKIRDRGEHYYTAVIATARKFLRFLFAFLYKDAKIS